jgi:hypothetical protein
MDFEIYGPFELPRKNGIIDITKSVKSEFWGSIEETKNDLSMAEGCYVFGLKASKGIKPWYVGKTDKQSFKAECLTDNKLKIFNQVVTAHKGKPVIFLLPSVTPKGKLISDAEYNDDSITTVEGFLIRMAVEKNAELSNIKHVKKFKDICVPGILNSRPGALTKIQRAFKKMMT